MNCHTVGFVIVTATATEIKHKKLGNELFKLLAGYQKADRPALLAAYDICVFVYVNQCEIFNVARIAIAISNSTVT